MSDTGVIPLVTSLTGAAVAGSAAACGSAPDAALCSSAAVLAIRLMLVMEASALAGTVTADSSNHSHVLKIRPQPLLGLGATSMPRKPIDRPLTSPDLIDCRLRSGGPAGARLVNAGQLGSDLNPRFADGGGSDLADGLAVVVLPQQRNRQGEFDAGGHHHVVCTVRAWGRCNAGDDALVLADRFHRQLAVGFFIAAPNKTRRLAGYTKNTDGPSLGASGSHSSGPRR